jgi:hypothetical protein
MLIAYREICANSCSQKRPDQNDVAKMILICCAALLLAVPANAQGTHFLPGKLAVLRAGDGLIDLQLKQSPIFVDQFDTNALNATPSFSVRIPTNGPNAFFINGHAASEGNLSRSTDHKLLTFGGYGGTDLLKIEGTASRLEELKHGICTVDGSGATHTYLYPAGVAGAKVNPRGVVTDGTNNFWGCGNAKSTYYYNPAEQREPVRFESLPSSRAIKIINGILYVSLNAADAQVLDRQAGLYRFQPASLPRKSDAAINLVVPSGPLYKKVVGFDMSPDGKTAYLADTSAGVQKYVHSGETWKLAYNFSIPQNIPQALNNSAGCFALVVDFGGSAPVIYATTTEGYGNSVNSNRVVRIVDTNATAVVTTLVQAGSTNIAYRGIDFTPN